MSHNTKAKTNTERSTLALLTSLAAFACLQALAAMAIPLTKPHSSLLIGYISNILAICLVFSPLSTPASAYIFTDMGIEDIEGRRNYLFPEILRDEAVARLNELGKVSDADGFLERTFLSPASVKAGKLIRRWMEDAGLRTWVDQMGNIHGRVEGMNASSEALLIGSHLDTVVDAGTFDGSLGIISALSALKVLKINGKLGKLRRPIEVIAFSDEEGVRFQSTFLGSAAVAGILPISALQITDKSGVTVQDVLKENSIETTEENLFQLKYAPESVWGYVEIHIEQGPVLEWVGLPLGVVKVIAGQTRLKKNEILIDYVSSKEMIADPLTKASVSESFKGHVDSMGIIGEMLN